MIIQYTWKVELQIERETVIPKPPYEILAFTKTLVMPDEDGDKVEVSAFMADLVDVEDGMNVEDNDACGV